MKKKKSLKETITFSTDIEKAFEGRPRRWMYTWILIACFLGLIIYSFVTLNIEFKDRNVWELFLKMAKGFANPNIDYLLGRGEFAGKNGIPYLTMQTIAIAFVGTFISSILAIPFGFLAARNVMGKVGSKVGEFFLIIIRTFPEILVALILVRVSGIGAFTGTVTIAIHSIGMLGKLYAESIENMDSGPLEALDAVGGNKIQKVRFGILPQVFPEFISTALYRFDINVRTATVLGVVAAGGLGAPLIFSSSNWHWEDLSSIMIAIILMVIVVDLVSSTLRKKLI